jgi:hypothetical protein
LCSFGTFFRFWYHVHTYQEKSGNPDIHACTYKRMYYGKIIFLFPPTFCSIDAPSYNHKRKGIVDNVIKFTYLPTKTISEFLTIKLVFFKVARSGERTREFFFHLFSPHSTDEPHGPCSQ